MKCCMEQGVNRSRYVQSTQNRNLVTFLQYIKKKVSQLPLCSIVMQNIKISYGGPVMFVAFLKKKNSPQGPFFLGLTGLIVPFIRPCSHHIV